MSITQEQTIWFPNIYSGRKGVYAKTISEMPLVELMDLVQKRANEDGEWTIDNGFVGNNEDKMRKMITWVSDPENIHMCVDAIREEQLEHVRTVDYVCRELANGSKWAV